MRQALLAKKEELAEYGVVVDIKDDRTLSFPETINEQASEQIRIDVYVSKASRRLTRDAVMDELRDVGPMSKRERQ